MQSGETALFWAATKGYDNIVQELVDHGAAVDLGRDEVTLFAVEISKKYHFTILQLFSCDLSMGWVGI